MRLIFLASLILASTFAHAQSNLYTKVNGSTLSILQQIEANDKVFYLSVGHDTVNSIAYDNYYFTSVDKQSSLPIRTVRILSDTAFNVFEQFQPIAVLFCLSTDKKHIHFFTVTDKDSSANNLAMALKFPKTINYLQLDTGLNVTIGPKSVLSFSQQSLYTLYDIGFPNNTQLHQVTLCYVVRDTLVWGGVAANSVAAKLLTVDDTGRFIADQFLGYEPEPAGRIFQEHSSFGNLYRTPDNKFSALVDFADSVFGNKWWYLFVMDSNMNVVDTFYYPAFVDFGNSLPGKIKASMDAYKVHLFYLPTGSLIRSSLGSYQDPLSHIDYSYYALGKGDASTGYIPSKLYFPPQSDTGDYAHNSNVGYYGAAYNTYDNRIYTFTSTKSYAPGFNYCTGGVKNAGQLACVDTNLIEKWVKYLYPRPGYCVQSMSISSPDNRNGILISGRVFKIADPNNVAYWEPFIYYVDSNSKLSTNDPRNPISISDQFSLYPNPAKGHVILENMQGNRYSYNVVNALGQTVMSGDAAGPENTLDISSFAAGHYAVSILSNGKNYVLRFLVQ